MRLHSMLEQVQSKLREVQDRAAKSAVEADAQMEQLKQELEEALEARTATTGS
jgi:ppGpp synthetase/RelA/SpoT-type nucleotidyltranferase